LTALTGPESACGDLACGELACGELACGELACGELACGELACGEHVEPARGEFVEPVERARDEFAETVERARGAAAWSGRDESDFMMSSGAGPLGHPTDLQGPA
jgi:hypothetical protein